MSLHTRCPQRVASTSAHSTAWRRISVRYYASQATKDPEWFQQVRAEMLARKPFYFREDLDLLHASQRSTTLAGFVPKVRKKGSLAQAHSPSYDFLTRFNAQVAAPKLLPDGTDSRHCPGEPWMRRMWAGGAVQLSPDVRDRVDIVRVDARAACMERIKDVRLQGADDAAKIVVTVERRFALVNRLAEHAQDQFVEADAERYFLQQVRDGVEWGDALMKEERNLVFLKAKTATELMAIQAGQTHEPRYLKSPTNPDFSHTLTPNRTLLFRYSAITFNAHLLHLDPSYARNIEGHRNLLVHGPLTLTLMLQVLTTHLQSSHVDATSEIVDSVEYRNLAPLYCDEEMRVCVKRKAGTDTRNAWDVWIEGPTGGMAVKAVIRTIRPRDGASSEKDAPHTRTLRLSPSVDTAAAQTQELSSTPEKSSAQEKSNAPEKHNAPDQEGSTTEQSSRQERRKLWRQLKLAMSPEKVNSHALPYLYSRRSPLSVRVATTSSSSRTPLPQPGKQNGSESTRSTRQQDLKNRRKLSMGQALNVSGVSPLVNQNLVESPRAEPAPAPTSSAPQDPAHDSAPPSSPPAPLLSLAQRQRQVLTSGQTPRWLRPIEGDAPRAISDWAVSQARIRSIKSDSPADTFSTSSLQKVSEPMESNSMESTSNSNSNSNSNPKPQQQEQEQEQEQEQVQPNKLSIRKFQRVVIRKTADSMNLSVLSKRRGKKALNFARRARKILQQTSTRQDEGDAE